MDIRHSFQDLIENGFQIYDLPSISLLNESRHCIASHLRELSNSQLDDVHVLNEIHTLIDDMNDKLANDLVLSLITSFKKKYQMDQLVYELCSPFIDKLLGPDIASQKNPNIVFQYPGSGRFSELHTDTPGNSPFELVVWVPLVDCYDTKSFFVIPKVHNTKLLDKYKECSFPDWVSFKQSALDKAHHLTLKYGQVLFFWSGLLHGSLLNDTDESRFSYNVRFKSLFAPHGHKDPLNFFRVLKTSPLTQLAVQCIN